MRPQKKVYVAIKYHSNHSNSVRIRQIMEAIAEGECHAVCLALEEVECGSEDWCHDLMRRAFAAIDTCTVVIIDATEKGVGIGIEAGYAYAQDIPIITIAEKGSQISDTLCGISTVVGTYSNKIEMKMLLIESLQAVLEKKIL